MRALDRAERYWQILATNTLLIDELGVFIVPEQNVTSSVTVPIRISPDELIRWYGGQASVVEARALDGRVVHFPANILRPFVTRQGVVGLFKISYGASGKYLGIERCNQA